MMSAASTEGTGTVATAPEQSIAFRNAYQSFYNSLPEQDQMLFAPCASASDLNASMEKLKSLARNQKRKSILSRIAGITEAFQPYLNIVDIMVSSNPHYTAIVWGSLRLILQVRLQIQPELQLI